MTDQASWRRANEPLFWIGTPVWITSLGCEGMVLGNQQNYPGGNTVTVAALDRTPWKLTTHEALADLVPGVRFLIEERP